MSTDSTGDYDGPVTEEISVTVNGETVTAEVEPRLKLSDFLRNECGLHGVRVGCEHGVCGACTVQQEGRTVKSCLSYAVQADGMEIETVEGSPRTARCTRFRRHSTRPTPSSVGSVPAGS